MAGPGVLPAGVVSFLLTDMEGSTRILRAAPDRYDDVVDLHHSALRAVWRAHSGHELGTEGDSFLVVFASADDAVAAAADAQRAVASANWPVPLPVRIRVGVHTGYARPREDDYRALVVHQTARVAAAAHGGQVLVTDDTARRLTRQPPGARLEQAGRFRVRDFDEPVLLHRLVVDGVPVVDAALRVRPADGHNIVAPTTSLVGREDDVASVAATVQAGSVVTVVGAGGVGKTRLAVEVALRVAPQWRDGVWLVDLAPLTSDGAVVTAVADAVGAGASGGVDPLDTLLEFVADRRMLVVLDNCEHLLDAVNALVVRLLQGAPGVGVLATSRIPLGLRAERAYRLGPLAPERAVELFLGRAATTAAVDRSVVAELVTELDRLPLAIELAAARTVTLPPPDILARLRSTTSVLSSRDPDLPDRQRSLDRLLDWSVALLPPHARELLDRLAAFAGGFDLEVVEALGSATGLPRHEVAELLWTLLDHSLVVGDVGAGETRFRLPVTVRTHVRSGLDPREALETQRRLAGVYLHALGPERPDNVGWVSRMRLELDNVRAVAHALAGHDDEVAQQLACSIARFHDVTDSFRAGVEETAGWVRDLVAETPARAALLALLVDLNLRVGELAAAATALAGAEDVAERVGLPPWADGAVARAAADVRLREGDLTAARVTAERGLELATSDRGRARLWNLVGIARGTAGDLSGAVSAFQHELAAVDAAGVDFLVATAHGNLAETYLRMGDLRAAAAHQRTCLELARAQQQTVLVALSVMLAARIVVATDAAGAVVLQTVADRVLAAAGYALYSEDRELRDQLLRQAGQRLGRAASDAARTQGAATELDVAAGLADDVLRRAADGEDSVVLGTDVVTRAGSAS
ncbi:MAG: adenylate/guanylate cyclase domain-containing protein [Actinomycetes bacterium]